MSNKQYKKYKFHEGDGEEETEVTVHGIIEGLGLGRLRYLGSITQGKDDADLIRTGWQKMEECLCRVISNKEIPVRPKGRS